MATFTSKATGNWSAAGQTTWNEVGTPGNGDTVTIQSGHDITVDVNTTVGSSPAAGGTTAIACNSTGSTLIIATGVTLTCRGDIKLTDTTLTMNAGSTLEFDASAAGSPSTALYLLQVGTTHVQPNAKFIANGTSGSRCTLRSNASGANARVTDGGFIQAGQVDATYLDCLRIGDATHNSFETWAQGDEGTFHLTTGVLDACGTISTTNLNQLGEFVLDGVTMKNTVSSDCVNVGSSDAMTVGRGLRSITGCIFDKNVKLFPPKDFTVQNTGFHGGLICTNEVWASFTGNLMRNPSGATVLMPCAFDSCYVLQDSSETNPHLVGLGEDRDYSIDGCIFEFTGSDGNGDCILVSSVNTSLRTVTVTHCLGLPNAAGQDSGTLVTLGGSANVAVVMTHCTHFVGGQGMLAVGESYAGYAGMIPTFQNNLAHDTSARGYKMFDSGSDDSVSDLVTAANADYNGGYNLLAGSNLKGYNALEFSSGSPGAHDVSGDPQFVDATRDIAAWDGALGGAGTVANALAELGKRNDAAGYNANYTIAALLTWVKAGFAPQNPAYQAAHDSVSPSNGWIGAVEGVTAPAGGVTHYVMMTA